LSKSEYEEPCDVCYHAQDGSLPKWEARGKLHPVSPEVAAGREKGNLLHYPDSRHGDVISLCLNGDIGFCEGNVIKYVTRWRKKNGLEDLYKAKTYLDRLIRFYKNKDINNV
jgi:hypothetical protein